MNYSITFFVFSTLAIVVLAGLVVIIRNSIRITSSYNFFRKKLKGKGAKLPKVNSYSGELNEHKAEIGEISL